MNTLNSVEYPKPTNQARWFNTRSLHFKLNIIISLGFVVTFAALSILLISNGMGFAKQKGREHDVMSAEMVAEQLSSALRFRDVSRITSLYRALIRDETAIKQIQVIHVDGTILAEFTAPDSDISPYEVPIAELVAKTQTDPNWVYVDKSLIAVAPVWANRGKKRIGTLVVVNDHTEEIAALGRKTLNGLAIGAMAAVAGLAVIAYLLNHMVLRPFKVFSIAFGAVSNREFNTEIPGRNRTDEIGAMAASLEKFRDVLAREQSDQVLREKETLQRQQVYARLSDGLSDLAAGKINREIDLSEFTNLDSEHTEICRNFNTVMVDLRRMLSIVTNTAETVRGRSIEISDMARDQSKRSEAQAATLEESAAAIEELNTSVQSTAHHAADASEQILANRKQAEAGGDVVEKTTEAMRKIEESSQQITAIIGVIDDIAFQTNLLALNAGVEAARAGDAGRGFAVVASEVRALAQRASESAHEIKGLILSSSEHVEEGSQLADQAGAALKDIIQGVSHVTEVVSQIATGSREQAENLAEIKEGIDDLDRVTQQNSAVIEETSAASKGLSEEAENMAQALRLFEFEREEMAEAPVKNAKMGARGSWAEEMANSEPQEPTSAIVERREPHPPQPVIAAAGTGLLAHEADDAGWDEF